MCVCVSFPLTSIILIEGVHAGEVDGEGLEGRRQADAALRSLHVQARRRARVGRLGQARLGILHAEYGSRRLGWLSAAPEADPPHPGKKKSRARTPEVLTPKEIGATTYFQQVAAGALLRWCLLDKMKAPAVQHHPCEVRYLSTGCSHLTRLSVLINNIFVYAFSMTQRLSVVVRRRVESLSSCHFCSSFWILVLLPFRGRRSWCTSSSSSPFVLRSPRDSLMDLLLSGCESSR